MAALQAVAVHISAGLLRHCIEIQQKTNSQTDTGSISVQWSEFALVRARIIPVSGNEKFQQDQFLNQVTHKIEMRYLKGVTPQMRILFDGRYFDIEAVIDESERNRMLTIMCLEKNGDRSG